MWRPASGLMMRMSLTALPLLVGGCVTAPNDSAICDGLKSARDAHTEALLEDGGDQSVLTGAALLSRLDAACGD